MSDLTVSVSGADVSAILENLQQSGMKAAWRRSLRKTGAWVKTHVSKELAQEIGIERKIIRRRLAFFLNGMDGGKIWFGLNALPAHFLPGVHIQDETGVTIGARVFPRAWIMLGGKVAGRIYRRVGKRRYPIELARFGIEEKGSAAFMRVIADVEKRLYEILAREVNYEIIKAERKAGRLA